VAGSNHARSRAPALDACRRARSQSRHAARDTHVRTRGSARLRFPRGHERNARSLRNNGCHGERCRQHPRATLDFNEGGRRYLLPSRRREKGNKGSARDFLTSREKGVVPLFGVSRRRVFVEYRRRRSCCGLKIQDESSISVRDDKSRRIPRDFPMPRNISTRSILFPSVLRNARNKFPTLSLSLSLVLFLSRAGNS